MENLRVGIGDPSAKVLKSEKSAELGTYVAKVPAKRVEPPKLAFTSDLSTDLRTRLPVAISYEVLGERIEYTALMDWPAPTARAYAPQLTRVKVRGRLGLDFAGQYAMSVELENGDVVGCEQRAQLPAFIPAGTPVDFEISPDAIWGHDIRSARVVDDAYRKVAFHAGEGITAAQADALQGRGTSGYPISSKGGAIELRFDGAFDIDGLLPQFRSEGKKANKSFVVLVQQEGEWHLASESVESRSRMLDLSASEVTAVRLTFAAGKSQKEPRLSGLTFIQTPTDVVPARRHW
jgi:hypothetical protein